MNKYHCRILLLLLVSVAVTPCLATAQSVVLNNTQDQNYKQKDINLADFKYKADYQNEKQLTGPITKKPGWALLSSAIIPGAGQAANGKWLRAGAYLLAEALLFTVHFKNMNDARREERRYEQFAEENWSVVTYAKWLDNYHQQNGITGSNELNELRQQVQGVDPSYDHETDWGVVDLELLRAVERNTPFVYPDGSRSNNFSHTLPAYGSQQYFELISKYFQYGPGWRDFGTNRDGEPLDNPYRLSWDGTDMSNNFLRGSALAESFNNNYRTAGNMLSLLVLNHIVSAFDAFLTVKIKNNRLKAETNLLRPEMFSLKYRF